ncbi:hypothetical protein FH968_02105 [Buttiauxella sp. B2]|uniref:hypothetical protein n=1 Tax=Buttiauxella sp. B2 TaxID=2587812 RepID=UPI0011238B42|nr:hypothetical protein [Buttiauxella sp. B2]TNV22857.1 hypothetical protein FH968_02105 [Buttiauxella sp. B2]
MKKLNLLIELHLECVIKSPTKDVIEASIGDTILGFISIEKDNDADVHCVTPFTNNGLMDEVHCVSCALKDLMQHYSGLEKSKIDLVETETRSSSSFAGVLAATAFMTSR